MTTFNRNRTLAALALATATFTAPAIAHAGNYNNAGYQYNECKKKDKDNQLVGGLLGAVAGGVIGSQVAGRGERTELSVLGAVIGGAAGAGIADDNRNCRKEVQRTTYGYGSQKTYNRGYQPARTYGNTYRHRGYQTVRHSSHPVYNRGYSRGYQTEFGTFYNSWEVRQRIEQLKDEDRPLKYRQKYEYSPWIDRRRAELKYEIKALKKIEDRLEKDERRGYRSY
jgi:uncharacterized protein YcfJ